MTEPKKKLELVRELVAENELEKLKRIMRREEI